MIETCFWLFTNAENLISIVIIKTVVQAFLLPWLMWANVSLLMSKFHTEEKPFSCLCILISNKKVLGHPKIRKREMMPREHGNCTSRIPSRDGIRDGSAGDLLFLNTNTWRAALKAKCGHSKQDTSNDYSFLVVSIHACVLTDDWILVKICNIL